MQLLRRFCFFVSPLLILLSLGEWMLWTAGETWPVSKVAGLQQHSQAEILYSRTLLSQQFGIYKLASIRRAEPAIVVVGSSRVMQFRDFMFAPLDDAFYNAGGMIESASDLDTYADLILAGEVPKPQVLLIGIDIWWFKPKLARASDSRLNDSDDAYHMGAHIEALKTVSKGKHTAELLTETRRRWQSPQQREWVGFSPALNGSGFRNDGSWQYPAELYRDFVRSPQFIDRESPPVVERIRSRSSQFSPTIEYDEHQVKVFKGGLEKLIAHDIEVIAFLPPFSSESLNAIRLHPELQRLLSDCENRLLPQLKRAGVTVVPLNQMDLSDEYMIDGFHPSEVYVAQIVLEISKQLPSDSILNQVDSKQLNQRISTAEIPLAFFVPAVQETQSHSRPNIE